MFTKPMVQVKSKEEIELCRQSSLVVEQALAAVAGRIGPGISGLQIDALAEQVIRDMGGVPAFKGFNGFPYSVCFSVNDQVVHGFPSEELLNDGDIVTVDIGVLKQGFHGDFAYSFALGEVGEEKLQLLKVTKEATYLGLAQAIDGNRIGDIGAAIQQYTESFGYGVVRDLVGHGLGRELHEPPEVPNYGKRNTGTVLRSGMVLAIEPMINMGQKQVRVLKDGWTIVTKDGKPSAHFEHNVAVQEGEPDLLSSYTAIENAIKNNNNLTFV